MDMAWSYYLQKKVEVQIRQEKEKYEKKNELVEKKKLSEKKVIHVNYCSGCGQYIYFCMCSKNLDKMNSKNLDIHIDDS